MKKIQSLGIIGALCLICGLGASSVSASASSAPSECPDAKNFMQLLTNYEVKHQTGEDDPSKNVQRKFEFFPQISVDGKTFQNVCVQTNSDATGELSKFYWVKK